MSRIDPSVFRNWNDGDIMHESDYEQERQILYTAINDNYDRLLQKYDKTEVDALLNAMKGAGWTNAITIKGNYDLIQSIIATYATDAEVEAIRATLQSQVTQNTNDIANRYTKAETDAKDANLQSQITFLSANKTDKTGDHQGTWQGLTPPQIGAGDMNASRLDYLEDVRIPAIEGQLDENDKYPVTVLPGLNIVTVPRGTPFNVLNLKGRTLINLLGRDGNCEDTSKWTPVNATVTLDTANKVYGTNAFKISSSTSGALSVRTNASYSVSNTKYYIALFELKNGNATNCYGEVIKGSDNSFIKNTAVITDTTKMNTAYLKLSPADIGTETTIKVRVFGNTSAAGQYFFVDGIRLYEISQAEYNALDSMTPEQIAAKYPYQDDFKGVKGPYILRYGSDGTTIEDYIFYDVTLHSNVDRTVTDELFYRDGQARKLKRFEEVVLDGSLNYSFVADYAGFKSVKVPVSNYVNGSGTVTNNIVVKYDGKIIPRKSSVDSGADVHTDTTTELYLSIADTDSGWTESMSASSSPEAFGNGKPWFEAFFNGWKCCNPGGGTWDGTTANLRWKSIFDGTGETNDQNLVKTTKAPGWTPEKQYRLVYQLAQPVEVTITSEGEISLFEGDNLLEVGTGVVRREAVNVNYNGTFYQINSNTKPLANKTNKILNVYKGTSNDTPLWTLGQNGDSATWNGGGYAYTTPDKYDPSAAYSVTYLVLDRYLYTASLIDLQGEYRTKLAGVVAELAQDQTDLATRVSVVETQYARKQQGQYIAPVLLNGWVNSGGINAVAGYFKDEFGMVHIKGLIKNGTVTQGTTLFRLPVGYRPSQALALVTMSNDGTNGRPLHLDILPTGEVNIGGGYTVGNTWLSLNVRPFRAEQ